MYDKYIWIYCVFTTIKKLKILVLRNSIKIFFVKGKLNV